MTTATVTTTQVYQLFIKATPEQVWDAITKPEFTTRYFYASRVEMADGRRRAYGPGGELWGDSAILEEDPPRRLVHEWQGLYDPDLAAAWHRATDAIARALRDPARAAAPTTPAARPSGLRSPPHSRGPGSDSGRFPCAAAAHPAGKRPAHR